MKKYKHIIWDWNGTMIDDIDLCVDIVNGLLSNQGKKQMTKEIYLKHFDFPVIDYYKKVGFDFTEVSFTDLCDQFISAYSAEVANCKLHHGAENVLEAFHQKGVKQSVLSAAEQQILNSMVKTFGVGKYFQEVSGLGDKLARSKVENGKRLVSGINCRSNEILMVGDTVHDFEVAQAMGIECILVSHGHHPKEKLEKVAPVIDSFEELIERI